jgi:hypothetical protein
VGSTSTDSTNCGSKIFENLGMVAHACNPSYSGGRDLEKFEASMDKKLPDPISRN